MPEWYMNLRGGIALLQNLLGTAVLAYSCRRRKHFILRILSSVLLGFCLNAWFSYRFFIPETSMAALVSQVATSLLIYLTLFGIAFFCLDETPWRILFFASAGTVVNIIGGSFKTVLRMLEPIERLSQDAWGILLVDILSYIAIDILLFFLLRSFTKKRDFYLDTKAKMFFSVGFALFYMGHSWLVQNYTSRDMTTILVESTYDILLCATALMVMFGVLEKGALTSRVTLLNELVRQQERQFEASKENAQLVNEKYHDLKKMLESMRDKVPVSQLDKLEEKLDEYDLHINSGNPVLDVLITEKLYICSQKQIRLTCSLGQTDFSGIEELDLYTIFQNILDNAIEAVVALPEKDERFIMLTASQRGNILTIHTENPCEGEVSFQNGLPQTHGDPTQHGFGVKSMLRTAEKYHGTVSARQNGRIFSLEVLLLKPTLPNSM